MSRPPSPDLSVNKVLAGAGAAVTSAVLGSFFGVAGTVVGAAVGSVASTVATSLYEYSLNRTRDQIKARLNAGSGSHPHDPPDPPRRRPWGRLIGGTALVFLLGMLVVTGIEFVKGSAISGAPGTSVGRVFVPSAAGGGTTAPSDATQTSSTTQARSTQERSTSSATASATPQPSASAAATPSAAPTTSARNGAPGADVHSSNAATG